MAALGRIKATDASVAFAMQQTRARDRHRRILDAALRVFSRRGYRDASVDDIADESRTSKGGVYFHFPGKEAIFLALLERTATRLRFARELPRNAASKLPRHALREQWSGESPLP